MSHTDAVVATDEQAEADERADRDRETRTSCEEMEPESDSLADWETVAELPASAKLVALVLKHEGPLSGTGLAEETRLPPRTVRYAVGRLEAADVVSEGFSLRDAREKRYQLRID